MSKKTKLNQILAITESQMNKLKGLYVDYIKFFKGRQSSFKGQVKTYEIVPGYVDIPTNRIYTNVVTTVDEKLDYFKEIVTPILNNVLSLEATNASGKVTADLIVGEDNWGKFSSLELLRLKNFLSSQKFKEMISTIPTRSDTKEWNPSGREEHDDRNISVTPIIKFEEKTTEKEEVILQDPNIQAAIQAGKDINYAPQKTMLTKQVVIGNGTFQEFSGEFTHHKRATILKKLSLLQEAVIDALQRANQNEVTDSSFDTDKMFNYLFNN